MCISPRRCESAGEVFSDQFIMSTVMTDLSPKDFKRISTLVRERWGLQLTERKMPLVANRLSSFVRRSDFSTVEQYLHHLEHDASEEDMLVFFDILSTNVTSFFRDRGHFDYLEREFYTGLARGNTTTPGRRIRIWSAGCSIGCEPYSMAMNAIESLPDLDRWDFKILATDLSNFAVEQAKAGIYDAKQVSDVPRDLFKAHFVEAGAGKFAVSQGLRKMVQVAQLNLMGDWPMRGPFDVIFCRNVMIYFDQPTRQNLVTRFYNLLRPGGVMAVGSAETLSGLQVPFKPVQASLYLK